MAEASPTTGATAPDASPTTSAAVPSQKRPLEDPSSPGGPGDQPDAKRQALDKVVKEEAATTTASAQSTDATATPEVAVKAEAKVGDPVANGQVNGGAHTDGQGDTVIPDAPAPVPDTSLPQPIQSAASNNGTAQLPAATSQDESQYLHLRSIISSTEAATVIGKSGENVTQIRLKSGAKVVVSEFNRGAIERILTISGPVDAVAKAFGLVIRTLNQEDLEAKSTAQSKTYPLRLLIPHILIGSVIGKGGSRIREIQEASGARLNASESCLPLSTERSLVVLGVADAVHIATYYVGSTLIEQLNERFNGPAASNYATRGGHPAGAIPGGMQVVPYVPMNPTGQWGHPDNYRRHTNSSQRTPANPYGISYLHGQPPPQPNQAQQPQAPAPYGASASPRTATGYNPQAPVHYPTHGAAMPAVGTAPPQTMGGPTLGTVTQQIYIPNDMVGAIIGKGGQKINEIRQLSGSVIKINEPQDNSNERLVTITGSQECNQMALYMLYQRLESEKHRICQSCRPLALYNLANAMQRFKF